MYKSTLVHNTCSSIIKNGSNFCNFKITIVLYAISMNTKITYKIEIPLRKQWEYLNPWLNIKIIADDT